MSDDEAAGPGLAVLRCVRLEAAALRGVCRILHQAFILMQFYTRIMTTVAAAIRGTCRGPVAQQMR